jgi:hypothetical protein
MANGKIHDHPYTDVVIHQLAVYSPKADGLIREIARLGDTKTQERLAEMLLRDFSDMMSPDVSHLERLLTSWRDQLRAEAIERGFEVDPE